MPLVAAVLALVMATATGCVQLSNSPGSTFGPKTKAEYVAAFHELVAEKTDVEQRLDQLINTWPNCPSKMVQLSPFGTPVCKVVEAAAAAPAAPAAAAPVPATKKPEAETKKK